MNKKLKKLILIIVASILAAVLLIFATIGAVKFVKNHIGTTVISFENKTALAGDTVQLSFNVVKNHGIWGGQIKINYDATAISFVSCANGDVFDECEVNGTDGSVNLVVNQSDLEDSNVNGTIATLNFKIKENAKKGDYKIEFDQITNFCDEDSEIIEPILESGVITVK
ncbi:MAG: hypothetical protein IJZ21_01105 [Clostridia bacterium]|nr:hypothetical protein [Clostridia bacterium]